MSKFSTYAITLLIIFLFIFIVSKTKKNKYFIFFTVLLLSIMAFLFNPVKAWLTNGNYTDLYRYWSDMDVFSTYGWNTSDSMFKTQYSVMPVTKLLIYFVSKIGIKRLLACLSCLLVYGIFGYVLSNEAKENKCSNKYLNMAFIIFIFLVNYKISITNIRMPIANSIFFLTLYNDLNKKNNMFFNIIGYILCCSIHSAFLLFVGLRLILFLIHKYNGKLIYIFIILYGTSITVITNILELYGSNSFVSSILYKINYYTNGTGSTGMEYPIFILGIIKVLMMLYLIYILKNKANIDSKNLMYKCTLLFTFFAIGSMTNFHLFHRVTNFLIYFIVYWQLYLCSDNLSTYKYRLINENRGYINLYNVICFLVVFVHIYYYFMSYQYNVLTF